MRMLCARRPQSSTQGLIGLLLCRLIDEPALGLYSKAGYEIEKEDCILVGLWDDRRQLLSKFIPRRKDPLQRKLAQEQSQEKKESLVAEYWQ